jgi:hypothetical protein
VGPSTYVLACKNIVLSSVGVSSNGAVGVLLCAICRDPSMLRVEWPRRPVDPV